MVKDRIVLIEQEIMDKEGSSVRFASMSFERPKGELYKKIEVMEKKFEKFEKAQNKIIYILKNKLISTQYVEEEIVIDVKFVNDGSDRRILIDIEGLRSIVSSKWLNVYLQDAKVTEEKVKK